MDNYAIADNFALLGKLMDIHGENSFKAKSYAAAAFTIEKLPSQLAEMPLEKIASVRGIGESIAKNIAEQLQTGSMALLQEYIQKTPEGILTMMSIKGIGPKKIATIWKELEIETIGELLYACNENRLANYKGFGAKSQQNIKEAIEFFMGSQGSYLYQQLESFTTEMTQLLSKAFPDFLFQVTADYRRQLEIITSISWITTAPKELLTKYFSTVECTFSEPENDHLVVESTAPVPLHFHIATAENFGTVLFKTTGPTNFLEAFEKETSLSITTPFASEQDLFQAAHLTFIPAFRRDDASIVLKAKNKNIKACIETSDIKGIIHSHSNWSDGAETLEAMAIAAKARGLEYLVISDHSQSAFYANGLREDRIRAQHQQIDELNKKLAPFRIYKSIESDILNDGSLDYDDEVLASFDLVIASIHSNLKMTEEKAMMRLMNAIENPYTSILGHMTGRLLLSRGGYPVNHELIIDACVANDVVIELNAHPRRLDIDWRWIDKAVDMGVLISINPDAHSIEGYDDCKYGVLVAQKAGLTKYQNLSSYDRSEFESFLMDQHQKRG